MKFDICLGIGKKCNFGKHFLSFSRLLGSEWEPDALICCEKKTKKRDFLGSDFLMYLEANKQTILGGPAAGAGPPEREKLAIKA